MIIYNGSDVALDFPNLPRIVDAAMGWFFPGLPNEKVFDVLDRDHFEAVLNDREFFTDNVPVIVDMEGSPNREDLAAWHYDLNPASAVALRVQTIEWCKEIRPDLKFYMYSIPWRMKGLSVPEIAERELAYRDVTQKADGVCITAYPKPRQTFDDWLAAMDKKIAWARLIHEADPLVYVTYKTSKARLTADEFSDRLKAIKDRGLDAALWLGSKELYIPWNYRYPLWLHTEGS